jgi:hypothetical protein
MLHWIKEVPFENSILCFTTRLKIGTYQHGETPQGIKDSRMPSTVQRSHEKKSFLVVRNALGVPFSILLY